MIMKHSSIIRELVVSLVPAVAVLWLVAAGISGFIIQSELNENFDNALQQTAARLLPLAMEELHELHEGEQRQVPRLISDDTHISYYLRSPAGTPAIIAENVPPRVFDLTLPEGFSQEDDLRFYVLTERHRGFSVVVIEDNEYRKEAFWQSLTALLLPLFILLPLMGWLIWKMVRRAMTPVSKLRDDIASRDSHNLSPTETEGYPQEISPIAQEVADLIDRLRAALNAERSFAATSAHELRTPIAGALAQVQRLSIELGDHPGTKRAKDIERALRHLAQLSEQLLQLSRLDAGFARSDSVNDLAPVLDLVVRDLSADTARADRIDLSLADDAVLKGAIEIDAFAIVVRNLVENALLHGNQNEPVQIFVDEQSRLHVSNSGSTVPEDLLARLSEPFERGNAKAKGTGLGLSIVSSVMRQSGGALTLHSPRIGHDDGFEAVLRFENEEI